VGCIWISGSGRGAGSKGQNSSGVFLLGEAVEIDVRGTGYEPEFFRGLGGIEQGPRTFQQSVLVMGAPEDEDGTGEVLNVFDGSNVVDGNTEAPFGERHE